MRTSWFSRNRGLSYWDIQAKSTRRMRKAERAKSEWNLATCLHRKQEKGSPNRPKQEIFIRDSREK
ncbi:hypothetical protein KI387_005074, partial [Taxus chinensis]